MAEASGNGKMNVDERLEGLTRNLKLLWHTTEERGRHADVRTDKLLTAVEKLVDVSNRDAAAISTLARIAEAH